MPEKRKKGQHLTWENRQEIQLGLKNHLSFAAIEVIFYNKAYR